MHKVTRRSQDSAAPVDLLLFDVDGTLLHHPEGMVIWELLNRRFSGDHRINEERFAAFRAGKITYSQWVDLDIGSWQAAGARRIEIIEAIAGLEPAPGAREALAELLARGYRLAVVSGTLDVGLEHVFPDHPFTDVFTNKISFAEDGTISGWEATPYDMRGKVLAMERLCAHHGVDPRRCAFVGDGINDVEIARAVGVSVAFHSRCEELQAVVDHVVPGPDLRDILPLFPR